MHLQGDKIYSFSVACFCVNRCHSFKYPYYPQCPLIAAEDEIKCYHPSHVFDDVKKWSQKFFNILIVYPVLYGDV